MDGRNGVNFDVDNATPLPVVGKTLNETDSIRCKVHYYFLDIGLEISTMKLRFFGPASSPPSLVLKE
ncbi:hypothetical protein PIB30_074895 [Stylosanthes scabra]|uniref:Uncharacterized protein n=1 Tax=Stylosanthes scabra TaxID=79078 RepID=A0ABU6QPX3_9FABA|nr:hypothetical protein [Stylosanthes scabra]